MLYGGFLHNGKDLHLFVKKKVSWEESLSHLGNRNTRYHEELKSSAWTRSSSTSYFNKGMRIELVPVQLESISPFSVFSWSIDLGPLPLTSSPPLHHLSLLEHWPLFLEEEGSTSIILPPSSLLLRRMCAKSIQLCPTLCDPMEGSPPGSSVHGILQARILEWVAMSSSRGSSRPRDRTLISCGSCIAGGFFTIWARLLKEGAQHSVLWKVRPETRKRGCPRI